MGNSDHGGSYKVLHILPTFETVDEPSGIQKLDFHVIHIDTKNDPEFF